MRNKLLARAANTRWDGVVQHAIAHPGFPVDARHNSKIKPNNRQNWSSSSLKQQSFKDRLKSLKPEPINCPLKLN